MSFGRRSVPVAHDWWGKIARPKRQSKITKLLFKDYLIQGFGLDPGSLAYRIVFKERIYKIWKQFTTAIDSYAPQSNNAPEFVFGTNLKYWSDATAFQSANNFDNANFNAIVAMKETAVPFIYKELLKGPTPLVHALDLIYPGVVTYHGFVSLEKSCQTWISILKKIGIE